mmetsp:Transcript_31437/g.71782  ORF Transcript_31437/g.71782 Transcript_31437/m.71782 type:complete len:513 (+) Transcript_31437:74-1612(+)
MVLATKIMARNVASAFMPLFVESKAGESKCQETKQGVPADSPVASLTVKNTFLDCQALPEGLELRKVKSEPASEASRRMWNGMPDLSIDTESDSSDPGCEPVVVLSDDDEEGTSAELFWPSTPEVSLVSRHHRHGLLSASTACPSMPASSWNPSDAGGTSSQLLPVLSTSSWGEGSESSPVQTRAPTMSWAEASESPSAANGPPTDTFQSMTFMPVCSVLAVAQAAPMQVMMNSHTTQPRRAEAPATQQGCLSTVPIQAASSAAPVEMTPSGEDAAAADGEDRGAIIARLQELLQCAENTALFKFPPGVKVLQWSYHEKREGRLLFRAVLHFLCNGVPHHVTGGWWPSKKEARQNAAEVGFALVQGLQLDSSVVQSASTCTDLSALQPGPCTRQARAAKGDCLERLDSLLAQCPLVTDTSAEWNSVRTADTDQWRAMMTVRLLGVKHTFSGPLFNTFEEAQLEVAKRVLWYLGSTGFEGFFVPNRRALLSTRCQVPAAPKEWTTMLTCLVED